MATSPCVPATGRGEGRAVRRVFAELAALVGDDQHVMIGTARERRDFRLQADVPAVGVGIARLEGPELLTDDFPTEALPATERIAAA